MGQRIALRTIREQRVFYCGEGHDPEVNVGDVQPGPECGEPMQAAGSVSVFTA